MSRHRFESKIGRWFLLEDGRRAKVLRILPAGWDAAEGEAIPAHLWCTVEREPGVGMETLLDYEVGEVALDLDLFMRKTFLNKSVFEDQIEEDL